MASTPEAKAEAPVFSVIVCTYNRAELLTCCLETLIAQTISPQAYEVVVVDNNSVDDTKAVVGRFAATRPNVRYVFEAEQGLSAARNRGVREARGNCLAFLDDECKVAPDWLSQAERIKRETQARVFGGPYQPWYQSDKPVWYKDAYGASQDIGSTGWLPDTSFVSGGNFFIDKRVLEEVGGFRTDLGMKGDQLGYGEETDLQIRFRKQIGSRVYYDGALLVWHCVRPEKLRPLWRIKASWHVGRQNVAMGRHGRLRLGHELLRFPLRLGILMGKGIVALFFRDRLQHPYFQNYLYEVAAPQVVALGRSYAVLTGEASRPPVSAEKGRKAGGDAAGHRS